MNGRYEDARRLKDLRSLLDESANRIDPAIVRKLDHAREAALARHNPSPRRSGRRADWIGAGSIARAWLASVTALALAVGAVITFGELDPRPQAGHQTAIDPDVLIDRVPLAAYADQGFGVYLRNWTAADVPLRDPMLEHSLQWQQLTTPQRAVLLNYQFAAAIDADLRRQAWEGYDSMTVEQREVLRDVGAVAGPASASNTAAGRSPGYSGLARTAAQPIDPPHVSDRAR